MSFSISFELFDTFDVARHSNHPVLLIGDEGIGKSEVIKEYANLQDLELNIIDLSLMNVEDFIGYSMNYSQNTFLHPNILPRSQSSTSHILVVKKINQCSDKIRNLAFQLLINRRIHRYTLPKSTFIIACMNASSSTHRLSEMESTIASHFLVLHVKPEPSYWLEWAIGKDIHPAVYRFVGHESFDFGQICPRKCVYISDLLKNMEREGWGYLKIERFLRSMIGDVTLPFMSHFETWYMISQKELHRDDIYEDSERGDIEIISHYGCKADQEEENASNDEYIPSSSNRSIRKI